MGSIRLRHLAGVFLGAVVSFLVVVAFIAFYSVAVYHSAALSPFEGSNTIGPFSGSQGTAVLVFLDFLIPLIAGLAFLGVQAVVSYARISVLEFSSRLRAVGEGALLGFAVFVLFYIPVLYTLSHPTPAQAVTPLLMGFIDHLAFGSALGLVIFLVGGPVPLRPREHPSS